MRRITANDSIQSRDWDNNRRFYRAIHITGDQHAVNRTDKTYVSVRMCSKEIQSTESDGGVNVLGAHLAEGATYIYQDGKEYENIFPVWDWHRIPGVTAYSNKALPEIKWEGLHNESDFVGGVSDTLNGIATMLFERDNLEARKGWFYGRRRDGLPGGRGD